MGRPPGDPTISLHVYKAASKGSYSDKARRIRYFIHHIVWMYRVLLVYIYRVTAVIIAQLNKHLRWDNDYIITVELHFYFRSNLGPPSV